MNKRKMQRSAVERLYDIMVKLWGNAWRMPKSVRDNYRAIEIVEHSQDAGMFPKES